MIIARRAMESMAELRHELGDIQQSLKDLHRDTNNTAIGRCINYSQIDRN